MKRAGHIVLFNFPQSNLAQGTLRPALVLGELPGHFDDWLICVISSQLQHQVQDFDELVQPKDRDFGASGLKVPGLVRVGRLAVVGGDRLLGAIGEIDSERLRRVKTHLAVWLTESSD